MLLLMIIQHYSVFLCISIVFMDIHGVKLNQRYHHFVWGPCTVAEVGKTDFLCYELIRRGTAVMIFGLPNVASWLMLSLVHC